MLDTNVFKIREYNRVSQSVTESHRVLQKFVTTLKGCNNGKMSLCPTLLYITLKIPM